MIVYRYHTGSRWDEWISYNITEDVTVPIRILYQRFGIPFIPTRRVICLSRNGNTINVDLSGDEPSTTFKAPIIGTVTIEVSFQHNIPTPATSTECIKTHPSYQQFADYLSQGILPARLCGGSRDIATAKRSFTNNCRRRFRISEGRLQQRARVAAGAPKFVGRRVTVKAHTHTLRMDDMIKYTHMHTI